jgi:hypothetical protein
VRDSIAPRNSVFSGLRSGWIVGQACSRPWLSAWTHAGDVCQGFKSGRVGSIPLRGKSKTGCPRWRTRPVGSGQLATSMRSSMHAPADQVISIKIVSGRSTDNSLDWSSSRDVANVHQHTESENDRGGRKEEDESKDPPGPSVAEVERVPCTISLSDEKGRIVAIYLEDAGSPEPFITR